MSGIIIKNSKSVSKNAKTDSPKSLLEFGRKNRNDIYKDKKKTCGEGEVRLQCISHENLDFGSRGVELMNVVLFFKLNGDQKVGCRKLIMIPQNIFKVSDFKKLLATTDCRNIFLCLCNVTGAEVEVQLLETYHFNH